MTIAAGHILTVNAGSSSVKLAVYAQDGHEMSHVMDVAIANNDQAALDAAIEKLRQKMAPGTFEAIGHRLVHGGNIFTDPTVTTEISPDDWGFLARLDPHHTPAARRLVEYCKEQFATVPQVACFDTSFFQGFPEVAKHLPIPKKYYEKGVRRYGFHGLSYTSLLSTFSKKAGEAAANGRVIMAHLGSGASLAATRSGQPIDTTMSFTPASGIPMSTRSGDLDPTVFSFLQREEGMSAEKFDHLVNFESGLLGVSGVTGDMRKLLEIEPQNKDAALAIELFVHNVKKSIGSLAAILDGVDSLLFTGGIGEQSAPLRMRICEGLEYMGIVIDPAANEAHSFLISAEHSSAGVHVIPTDEARVIAEQTVEALSREGKD